MTSKKLQNFSKSILTNLNFKLNFCGEPVIYFVTGFFKLCKNYSKSTNKKFRVCGFHKIHVNFLYILDFYTVWVYYKYEVSEV